MSYARTRECLAFFLLNNRATHVITAFRANGVGRNGGTALRAITDLASLDVVMRSAFACATVGVFTFWDSHRCLSIVGLRLI